MKGFWSDAFRLYWAALYWNLRKTFYRLGRTRGTCPCQHHSDSGAAWETACTAITHWQNPARFRRVCPLLKQRADGLWRCSVDAENVRPFWLRATTLFAGTGLALILIGVLGLFAGMRVIGYEVSLRQIVWPPAWSELAAVRSAHFIQKSTAAAARGDIRESLLALYNAYELDPSNYAVGVRLARLWQINQPHLSDQVYQRLLHEHARHRAETSRLWLHALLARGDLPGVRSLSADRLIHETTASPAWLHALIHASARTGDYQQLRATLASPELPASAAVTLRLVSETAELPPAQERARLIQTVLVGSPDAYTCLHIGRRLLQLGHADETLALTLRPDVALQPRERILLRLDALASLGRDADRATVFNQVLDTSLTEAGVELLCAHLIRHPSPLLADALFTRTDPGAWSVAPLGYGTRLALFAVAGVLAEDSRLQTQAAHLRALGGGEFRTLDTVRGFFLRNAPGKRIESVLPILQPLPLDITYALLDAYAPR